MTDKILVTNRGALIEKYGRQGFGKVVAAVKQLIAADRKKGISTTLFFLDDPGALKKVRGRAVTDFKSGREHKEAIDALYSARQPEYIVIVDAPDVVPHCSLANPTPEDDDPDVPSDLPYACDAPFSRDPKQYLAITRVVGRIPGIYGADRPTFLVKALKASAGHKPSPRRDYLSYFAISAQVWLKSTEKSVKAIFGRSDRILVSPPIKNSDANRHLPPLMHFINCHGETVDPNFYGERNERYPIALKTDGVGRHVRRRTVVAAECCYGAELYDPTIKQAGGKPPIAVSYFNRGAVGFFGSTNIAYGEAARMGAADLITQYFMVNVLAGASLGRACLQARQKFVDGEDLDKYNLKTIAQFILLGDPSLHPCQEDDPAEKRILNAADRPTARAIRRMELAAMGKSVGESSAFIGKKKRRPGAGAARHAETIARGLGLRGGTVEAFTASGGPLYRKSMSEHGFKPDILVVSKKSRPIVRVVDGKKRTSRQVRAVVVHTLRGRIARVAHYVSR
jgi:hypothetical protein